MAAETEIWGDCVTCTVVIVVEIADNCGSSFSSLVLSVVGFDMNDVSRDSIWCGRAECLVESTVVAVAATVATVDVLLVLLICELNDCEVVVAAKN